MHKPDLVILGATIKKWRKAHRLSRSALSEQCGFTTRHLANIEVGKINPSFDLLFSIVHVLQIPPDDLFYPARAMDDTRAGQLMKQFEVCSDEIQEIIVRMVECLIYNLSKAK